MIEKLPDLSWVLIPESTDDVSYSIQVDPGKSFNAVDGTCSNIFILVGKKTETIKPKALFWWRKPYTKTEEFYITHQGERISFDTKEKAEAWVTAFACFRDKGATNNDKQS